MRPSPGRVLRALRDGDPESVAALAVDHHRSTGSAGRTVTELLAPAQASIGELWAHDRISVAEEHLATAAIDRALHALAVDGPGERGTVAIVCAEGEWHTLPARMAATVWRDHGWHVHLLGGSVPAEHLERTLPHLHIDLLAVSCSVPLFLPGAATTIAVAHRLGIPVVAGGRAFGMTPWRARQLGAHWSGEVAGAPTLFERLLDAPPAPIEPTADVEAHRALELLRPRIVTAVADDLLDRWPGAAGYDARQRARTREDVDFIVGFLAAALLVRDPSVFTDFLTWLDVILESRGVPTATVPLTLAALSEQLGTEAPAARRLLEEVLAATPV